MSLSQLTKVSRQCCCVSRQFHTNANPMLIYTTPNLMGEPMKKRKTVDIGTLVNRTQSKINRIEKELRKLEKMGRKLKPVEEIIGKVSIRRNKDNLKREVEPPSTEELKNRIFLTKKWGQYKMDQHSNEAKVFSRALECQVKALEELRKESEDLYQKAKQIEDSDILYQFKGPVETPPVEDFPSPDGNYADISKNW